MWNKACKLLLFDLDGTLLQSDKTISKRTLSVLKQYREKGLLIGVSTIQKRTEFYGVFEGADAGYFDIEWRRAHKIWNKIYL